MSFFYPGFSPTLPYGTTGRKENLRTRLRRFEERNYANSGYLMNGYFFFARFLKYVRYRTAAKF